jgi:hypothetical protein
MSAQGGMTAPAKKANVVEFPRVVEAHNRVLVPREHGSWALWLLPLISGGIVGYASSPDHAVAPILWFVLVAAAAFLIHQPLESLLGVSVLKLRSLREQRIAVFWVMGLTMAAAVGVIELLRLQRGPVFVFALVGLGCFALGALFGKTRSLRVAKQVIGALGLSATAAGAYYVTAGRINRTALVLWLAAWFFATSQIEYVQLRLRTAFVRSSSAKAIAGWRVGLLHLTLLAAAITSAATGIVPTLFSLVFIPATIRLYVWMSTSPRPLKLYVLGFSELFQSVVFNTLLTAAFLLRV